MNFDKKTTACFFYSLSLSSPFPQKTHQCACLISWQLPLHGSRGRDAKRGIQGDGLDIVIKAKILF